MRQPLRTSAAAALLAGVTLGSTTTGYAAATPVAAGPALGDVTIQPATGTDQAVLDLLTTAACPVGGTNVIGTLFGPQLPDIGVNVITNTAAKLFPRTAAGGYYLISNNTLRNLLSDQAPDADNLKGTYRVRVECRGPSKVADLGDFWGSVTFDGHHHFSAKEPDVPTSALASLPAATDQPVPPAATSSAAGAAVPTTSGTPVAAKATSGGKGGGMGRSGPWLIAIGAVLTALGLSSWFRGRRTGRVATG